MKKTGTILCGALAMLFAAVMAFSGYQIWNIQSDYNKEAEIHSGAMQYKPEGQADPGNQSIIALQAQYPDVAGWINIPNTKVDYPFVWYSDNDYFLRHDLNGAYAQAGTIFMDTRCRKDFSSQNTILYGHHMKNGSMFGTLKLFNDKVFFEANQRGAIYLPGETLTLAFFACLVLDPGTETEIYQAELRDTYFDYVRQNARFFREIEFENSDRIVTLSTCAYEFDDARMVLLAKVL